MASAKRWAFGLIAVVAALALLGCFIPFRSGTFRYCRYCRASFFRERVLGVTVRTHRYEGRELTRYWLREVEPQRVHTWGRPHRYFEFGTLYSGVGEPMASLFSEKAEIAVLRSLATSRERKAIVERVWAHEQDELPEAREQAYVVLRQIDLAYQAKPDRRDWPQVLRQLHVKTRP